MSQISPSHLTKSLRFKAEANANAYIGARWVPPGREADEVRKHDEKRQWTRGLRIKAAISGRGIVATWSEQACSGGTAPADHCHVKLQALMLSTLLILPKSEI